MSGIRDNIQALGRAAYAKEGRLAPELRIGFWEKLNIRASHLMSGVPHFAKGVYFVAKEAFEGGRYPNSYNPAEYHFHVSLVYASAAFGDLELGLSRSAAIKADDQMSRPGGILLNQERPGEVSGLVKAVAFGTGKRMAHGVARFFGGEAQQVPDADMIESKGAQFALDRYFRDRWQFNFG